jgi:hypothetical protein
MASTTSIRSTSTNKLGWGIIAGVGALLLVSAAWLYGSVGHPDVVHADTGVALAELAAAFPTVAHELTARGRTIALLVAALALLALSTTAAGWRSGGAATRPAVVAFAVALAAIGAHALVAGRADVGGFYLLLGALAAVGAVLATRDARA